MVENKKHGKGTLSMTNGDKMEGNWKNNLMDGEINFITKEGKIVKQFYSEGKLN